MISLFRYRRYIIQNAKADLRHRYTGTGLGVFWNVINPLAQIAVYAVVFSKLMKARLPNADSPFAWVLYLSSGILTWTAFNECVTRGVSSFIENAAYLKKLPIPEQVFVARTAVAATFSLAISLTLLLALTVLTHRRFEAIWLLAPVACLLWQMMGFGMGLLLGTVNVFIRDVGPIVAVIFQIWMWTVPIIYIDTILSDTLLKVIRFNPPYPFILTIHDLLVFSTLPPAWVWPAMAGWAALFTTAGFLVLRALRAEIRDML